jgi:hypothetical protein
MTMFDRHLHASRVFCARDALIGGVTVSTCSTKVEQRAEVLDPRKSSGKPSIANNNLALAA